MPPSRHTINTLLNNHHINETIDLLSPHLPGASPSSNTRLAYLATVRAYLTWADREWRSVLTPDPQQAYDYLRHLHQTLAERSVRIHLSRLKKLYQILHQLDLTTPGTNPFALITPPNLRASEARDAYTPEEVTRLVLHADHSMALMVLLGAHGGLTKHELLSLTWRNVTPIPGGVNLYGHPIPDSKILRDALNAHARASGQGSLSRITDLDAPLFDLQHEYLLRRRLFKLCRFANVPPLAWTALRNHAILRTLTYNRPSQVQQVLTHSDRRNSYVVRELRDQRVILGPRRLRRQQD